MDRKEPKQLALTFATSVVIPALDAAQQKQLREAIDGPRPSDVAEWVRTLPPGGTIHYVPGKPKAAN